MKVLFWLNTFLPDVGGIQTLCERLIPELQGLGHEILLLTDRLFVMSRGHLIEVPAGERSREGIGRLMLGAVDG